MIRYFIRQYWRYIAMGLAFATISYFLGSCDVHAETNYTQSITIQYNDTSTSADRILWNDSNHTSKAFSNAGRGYLIGIILAYRYGTSVTFELPTIYSINARTDSGYSTCEVSSLANNSDDSTQMKASMYGFKCDLTMGANGLISLSANFAPTVNTAFTVESYRLTFNNNLDAQQVSYTQYIYSYMQDWIYPRLQNINNNTLGTYQELQYIYSYMQQYIYTKIEDIKEEIEITNGKLDEIISNNEVCSYINKEDIKTDNKFLGELGEELTNNDYGITNYYKINNKTKIKRIVEAETNQNARYCFYTNNKEKISCHTNKNQPIGIITIPNNASYIRFSIQKSVNKPQFEICDTAQNIQNQQNQEIINSQKETNDTLKDSSVDDPDSDLEDMQENEISNSVISDLLLLPINMFENIIDAIGGTCSSFSLGALFGTSLVLPCIDIPSLIGGNLWSVIDVLFCGIFVLSIRKKFVDIFENITSLKDRGNELE